MAKVDDIERIAKSLSPAQRAMLTRPNGLYQDNTEDVERLMKDLLWGVSSTSLGYEVATFLREHPNV